MSKLAGKVAFVTGAARGQGRCHAVRLAQEGADVIAVDLISQIASVPYPLATSDDLSETARLVEGVGSRVVALEADVRDAAALRGAVADGVARLGRVDVVVANAGICIPQTVGDADETDSWQDTIDVNLTGVYHTIRAALPPMIERGEGGSIIIIGSTAGLKGFFGAVDGGPLGYGASKAAGVGLMRALATMLAPHAIRVNTVHPAGVDTPMVINEAFAAYWEARPDDTSGMDNKLPVEILQPNDISDAVCWLASDEARYVTGVSLPVDAGMTL